MINGMDEITGKSIDGLHYYRQCISRVLRTELQSLINFREFGTNIDEFVDSAKTPWGQLDLATEITEALDKWTPWFKDVEVKILQTQDPKDQVTKILIRGITPSGETKVVI